MAYVSKQFNFCYKLYIFLFLIITSINIFNPELRFHYLKHLFAYLVFACMGFGSIAIYMSRFQMKLTDRLEDIVDEKGGTSKTSVKFFIFLSYSSLLMAVLGQTFWFYYSLCSVLGWYLDWAHRPLIGNILVNGF